MCHSRQRFGLYWSRHARQIIQTSRAEVTKTCNRRDCSTQSSKTQATIWLGSASHLLQTLMDLLSYLLQSTCVVALPPTGHIWRTHTRLLPRPSNAHHICTLVASRFVANLQLRRCFMHSGAIVTVALDHLISVLGCYVCCFICIFLVA